MVVLAVSRSSVLASLDGPASASGSGRTTLALCLLLRFSAASSFIPRDFLGFPASNVKLESYTSLSRFLDWVRRALGVGWLSSGSVSPSESDPSLMGTISSVSLDFPARGMAMIRCVSRVGSGGVVLSVVVAV